MSESYRVSLVRRDVEAALDRLSRLFKPGVKLTFIARTPGFPESDLIITSDTPDGIVEAADRAHIRAKE